MVFLKAWGIRRSQYILCGAKMVRLTRLEGSDGSGDKLQFPGESEDPSVPDDVDRPPGQDDDLGLGVVAS